MSDIMEKKCKKTEKDLTMDNNAQDYSGVAINRGDDNKVTEKLVKERTSTLNNNPRNSMD